MTINEILLARRAVERLSELRFIPLGIFPEDLQNAVKIIEKQIPKKYEIWNGQDCCPACKALFGSDETRKRLIHWEMDYCKYCGQALDWG